MEHQLLDWLLSPQTTKQQLLGFMASYPRQQLQPVFSNFVEELSTREASTVPQLEALQLLASAAILNTNQPQDKFVLTYLNKADRISIWIAICRGVLSVNQQLLDFLRQQLIKKVDRVGLSNRQARQQLPDGTPEPQLNNQQPSLAKFWEYLRIDKFYAYIITRDPRFHQPLIEEAEYSSILDLLMYVVQFFRSTPKMLSPRLDFRTVLTKYLCMNRYQKQRDKLIVAELVGMLLQLNNQDPARLNLRICLQFFRYDYEEKLSLFNPHFSLFQLIRKVPVAELPGVIAQAEAGLIWQDDNYRSVLKNMIKMGITQHTLCILVKVKEHALKSGRVQPMVQVTEADIHKCFIYIKHDKLFASSLEVLREFVLGAPARNKILEKIVTKLKNVYQVLPEANRRQLGDFVAALRHKYLRTCDTKELGPYATPDMSQKDIDALFQKYDWLSYEAKLSRKPQANNQLRGLCNIGNTCYMNSFLQAMYMTQEFRFRLLDTVIKTLQRDLVLKQNLPTLEQKKKALQLVRSKMVVVGQLQKLFALLMASKRPYVHPGFLKNTLPVEFRNFFQHDSAEFGRIFLSSLQQAGIEIPFEGETTTQITCGNCGTNRQRIEKFMDVMLSADMDTEAAQNLVDMLRKQGEGENIEGLHCQACDTRSQKSVKRIFLSKLPPYLIFSLNRFAYDVSLKKRIKLTFKIDLPEVINLNQHSGDMACEESYMLYGIVVHRGQSAESGHYYSFCREKLQIQSGWVCFDDSNLSSFASLEAVTDFLGSSSDDTPYLLFYESRRYLQNLAKTDKLFSTPFILPQKLVQEIQKQDMQYLAESSLKPKKLQLPKFLFGDFYKQYKDEDESSGGFGGGNSMIM